jgi:hypothetical protein
MGAHSDIWGHHRTALREVPPLVVRVAIVASDDCKLYGLIFRKSWACIVWRLFSMSADPAFALVSVISHFSTKRHAPQTPKTAKTRKLDDCVSRFGLVSMEVSTPWTIPPSLRFLAQRKARSDHGVFDRLDRDGGLQVDDGLR